MRCTVLVLGLSMVVPSSAARAQPDAVEDVTDLLRRGIRTGSTAAVEGDSTDTEAGDATIEQLRSLESAFIEIANLELPCDGPEARESVKSLRGRAYELAERYDRVAEESGDGYWASVARLFAARTLHEADAEYWRTFWDCPCDVPQLTEEQCELYRQGLALHVNDFLSWDAVDRYREILTGPTRVGCCSKVAELAREGLEDLAPDEYPPTVEILPDGDHLAPAVPSAGYAR